MFDKIIRGFPKTSRAFKKNLSFQSGSSFCFKKLGNQQLEVFSRVFFFLCVGFQDFLADACLELRYFQQESKRSHFYRYIYVLCTYFGCFLGAALQIWKFRPYSFCMLDFLMNICLIMSRLDLANGLSWQSLTLWLATRFSLLRTRRCFSSSGTFRLYSGVQRVAYFFWPSLSW